MNGQYENEDTPTMVIDNRYENTKTCVQSKLQICKYQLKFNYLGF